MSYVPIFAFLGGLWLAANTFFCAMLWKRHKAGTDPRVLAVMKRIGELEIEMADLRDLYERLLKSHKRLRSSAGMAKLRGMKEERSELPSEADIMRRVKHYGVKTP